MLRIERVENGNGKITIRATGRLAGPWVIELERSLADRDPTKPVVVDLTDVSFVDRDGVAFLRMLRLRKHVDLRCSAFVAEQIT